MKAAAFDYARPARLAEAIQLLARNAGVAKLLAGGQSLGPMLNLRLARPDLLVDIGKLEELKGVADNGDHWRIGAGVLHATLEDAAGKMHGLELIPTIARSIAYRTVRNRGTMGGSLAHADPAGDWPLAMSMLNGELEIAGANGTRRQPVDGFMEGAFDTCLTDDEIIVAVRVPKLSARARWGYWKFCRKPGEFPQASAACVFDPQSASARVFLGALAGPPRALPDIATDVAATGRLPSVDELDLRIAVHLPALEPIPRRIHAAVLERALKQAVVS
jgi:carbon-monoxide dehydrogenase medium subunit